MPRKPENQPRTKAGEEAPRASGGSTQPVAGPDVLVIEDDRDTRRGLTLLLEKGGYAVTAVDDGLAALEELRRCRTFRAIICDIGLPYLAGTTFYSAVEKAYPDMARRMIFVTGSDDDETRQFLRGSGRPFLKKPYDLAEVMVVTRHVVNM